MLQIYCEIFKRSSHQIRLKYRLWKIALNEIQNQFSFEMMRTNKREHLSAKILMPWLIYFASSKIRFKSKMLFFFELFSLSSFIKYLFHMVDKMIWKGFQNQQQKVAWGKSVGLTFQNQSPFFSLINSIMKKVIYASFITQQYATLAFPCFCRKYRVWMNRSQSAWKY